MKIPCLFSFLVLILTACANSANPPIHTEIISGGEVTILEVRARYSGQSVVVLGTGVEEFPFETYGHARIAFLNPEGRTFLIKDVEYKAPDWRFRSPRMDPVQYRFVTFSVTVSTEEPVASVSLWHVSDGRRRHDWSLQYALDWLINKLFPLAR